MHDFAGQRQARGAASWAMRHRAAAAATYVQHDARRFRNGWPGKALASLVVWASLAGAAQPVHAQAATGQPYYANGEIHCPDGSSATFQSSGEPPTEAALQLGCSFRGTSAAPPPASAPATAPPPTDLIMPGGGLHGLLGADSLADRPDPAARPGEVRCPDGTSRPFPSAEPNELMVAMLCSESAEVLAERHRRVTIALERKKLEAQMRGDEGVWAALRASWQTGSPAYLLGAPWFWLLCVIVGVLLVAGRFNSKR